MTTTTGTRIMSSVVLGSMLTSLKDEYSRVQEGLKDVETNIRKLTGGSGKDVDLGKTTRPRSTISSTVKRPSSIVHDDQGKRRRGSADDDDDEEDEEVDVHETSAKKKPLMSSIVMTSANTRKPPSSRITGVLSQSEDASSKPEAKISRERNRRMFGMILGTLAKFQSEESKRKDLTQRRVDIEKKLEREQEQEMETVHSQRQELIRERRMKQAEMKKVENKMLRMEGYDVWEKNTQLLSSNFIQTKSKPCIFYLPKNMTPEMERRQKSTRDKYRVIVAEKRAKVHKDLNDIEEAYEKEVADFSSSKEDDKGKEVTHVRQEEEGEERQVQNSRNYHKNEEEVGENDVEEEEEAGREESVEKREDDASDRLTAMTTEGGEQKDSSKNEPRKESNDPSLVSDKTILQTLTEGDKGENEHKVSKDNVTLSRQVKRSRSRSSSSSSSSSTSSSSSSSSRTSSSTSSGSNSRSNSESQVKSHQPNSSEKKKKGTELKGNSNEGKRKST